MSDVAEDQRYDLAFDEKAWKGANISFIICSAAAALTFLIFSCAD
jgi:hypothetical protein